MELNKLEALQLPDCVAHNDLWSSNVYKPASAENYMLFDFVEGYVSHPLVGYLSSFDKDRYLHEWKSRSEVSVDELRELQETRGFISYTSLCCDAPGRREDF